MKKISYSELPIISGGKSPWRYFALAIIQTIEYGFDRWKDKRQKKFDRLDAEEEQRRREKSLPAPPAEPEKI